MGRENMNQLGTKPGIAEALGSLVGDLEGCWSWSLRSGR